MEEEMTDAQLLETLKAMSGAADAQQALAWVNALVKEALEARRVLGSLSVVGVIMADGEAIGLQLPAGRQTPASLDAIRDGLLQSAVNVGSLARVARQKLEERKAEAGP